jgi:hypothetical protein
MYQRKLWFEAIVIKQNVFYRFPMESAGFQGFYERRTQGGFTKDDFQI